MAVERTELRERGSRRGATHRVPLQYLINFKFNVNFNNMKTVTMLEFRRNAKGVLRRIAKGERILLSHRGKAAARLEPLTAAPADLLNDPFLGIGRRATPSPKGKTQHADIDRILYGRR
jgi:antitoxin (DNA-binding transcriptional repressor) of toxin-antitoxin stability system